MKVASDYFAPNAHRFRATFNSVFTLVSFWRNLWMIFARHCIICITMFTAQGGEGFMASKVSTVPTAVRLPAELIERYNNLAKATGRSRTYYVTQALQESIAQLEYEYGLLKKVEDYRGGRLETVTIDELEDHLGLAD